MTSIIIRSVFGPGAKLRAAARATRVREHFQEHLIEPTQLGPTDLNNGAKLAFKKSSLMVRPAKSSATGKEFFIVFNTAKPIIKGKYEYRKVLNEQVDSDPETMSQVKAQVLPKIFLQATGLKDLVAVSLEAMVGNHQTFQDSKLAYLRGWLHFSHEAYPNPGPLQQDSEPFIAVFNLNQQKFKLVATRPHWKDRICKPETELQELTLVAGSPWHTLYPVGIGPFRLLSSTGLHAKTSVALARMARGLGTVSRPRRLTQDELGVPILLGKKPAPEGSEELRNSSGLWTKPLADLKEILDNQVQYLSGIPLGL